MGCKPAALIHVEGMAARDRSFWKDHSRCKASSSAPICCATLSKALNLSEIEFFHVFERDHYMFLNHLNDVQYIGKDFQQLKHFIRNIFKDEEEGNRIY